MPHAKGTEHRRGPAPPDGEELLTRLTRALEPRAEILEAYLFGSRGRGDARPDSDVDVAVYIDKARATPSHWGYDADLITLLMLALGTNDIDVVVLNDAPPLLYHRVLRDGIRLLSRDLQATTTRAGYALSRYFDFLPQLDKMDAARRFAASHPYERPSTSGSPTTRSAAPDTVTAIGVDGCKAGWFFVELAPTGASRWGVVSALESLVRDAPDQSRIFVDIPIGFPEGSEGRECDEVARHVLGARGRSVFSAPVRDVFDAHDYDDAKRRSQEASGRKIPTQTWEIVRKCREVDELLRGSARARRLVREVHPEVCFWALAGGRPMKLRKKEKRAAGYFERLDVLARLRPQATQEMAKILTDFRRKDVGPDDVADAMAAALTASAPAEALQMLPPKPPRDLYGLPMEMVYCEARALEPTMAR